MSSNLQLSLFNYGLAANRPTTPDAGVSSVASPIGGTSAGPSGVYYYATDTGVLSMYVNGAWVNVLSPVVTPVTATFAIPVKPYQILFLNAVAGFVATLPTATGSGNTVEVVVKTTLTSGVYEISVTAGDTLGGTIVASKGTTPTPYQATIGTTLNVSLTNAAVGGGIKGDNLVFTDVAPNVWEVQGNTWVTGTVATPFS
jgi:hypothetical protein